MEQPYPTELDGKPLENYTQWFFLTYALSVTGLPVISVPAGFTRDGLPVGIQIVGRRRQEAAVLRGGRGVRVGGAVGGPHPARRRRGDLDVRRFGLRILSANLANGRADAEAFADLVEAVEPDVVVVQELDPAQAEALARVLPFGKLEPARDHDGMGIALRAPGSVRALRLPYRSAFVAELAGPEDDEPVEVLNVHLAAPHVHPVTPADPGPARPAPRDRRPSRRHAPAPARAGRRPQRDARSGPRTGVCAPGSTTRPRRRRAGSGAGPGARGVPWAGSVRLLRIDHVLVRGLVATETRVLPIRGSDHSALVADLVPADP